MGEPCDQIFTGGFSLKYRPLRVFFLGGSSPTHLLSRGNCKQPTCFSHFFCNRKTVKHWGLTMTRKNKNKINGSYCWHSGVTLYQRKWEVNADKVVCLSRFYMVLRMFYDIKWNSNFNIEFHSFGFVASCEDWNQAITHLRFKDKDPWKKLLDSIMFPS